MDDYPREAWVRIGEQFAARRGQIDPRYRVRKVFAEEVGLKDTLLGDLEKARRTTFPPATIASFEKAYRLKPGSFRESVASGQLTPAQDSPGPLTVVESPQVPPHPDEIRGDRFLEAIWDEPAPEGRRWAAIYGAKAWDAAEERRLRAEHDIRERDETKRA